MSVTFLKSCNLHICFALYAIFVVIVLVDCFSADTHLSQELLLSPLDAFSLHLDALEPHLLLVLLGTQGAAHVHHGLRVLLLGALDLNLHLHWDLLLLLLLLEVLLMGLLVQHCHKHTTGSDTAFTHHHMLTEQNSRTFSIRQALS